MNTLRRMWKAIRYGAALDIVRFHLKRMGVTISPYYWIQEGVSDGPAPVLEDEEAYSVHFFGPEEISIIAPLREKDIPGAKLYERLEAGQKCLGIRYRGEIAAFMWFDLDECNAKENRLRLGDHEAYLFDMYTLMPFRGRNIAPYLRYQSYRVLREMGRDTLYSISMYLNRPAVRFKRKLDARFLWLGLYVELFKRVRWHWIIKRYDSAPV
jgi:hypothetical protein